MPRVLDPFRDACVAPGQRMDAAVEIVRSERRPGGRRLLDPGHPGRVHLDLHDGVGAPSWHTRRATCVLARWEGS